MKIAYLILAHTAPVQLGRLTRALSSDSATCFVHVDAKSDLGAFGHLDSPGVRFTSERIRVIWGDYSQVRAILVLLRSAVEDPCRFDRFVLISGVDHPLRSAAQIEQFFDLNRDREFISVTEIPNGAAGKPISRMTTYQPRPRAGTVGSAAWKLSMSISRRVHRRDYTTHLNGLTPYGGSTWWALTRQASEFVLAFESRETRIVDFFRHAISPDESFFHTILGNSGFRPSICPNLTFADWSAGGARPAAMDETHLRQLVADRSDRHLFARKFSDDDVTERLDSFVHDSELGRARSTAR